MRSGDLFAGVGGLGMAVDAVFGSTPAWFAEFDDAPSRVLAHRYPGVPNHGDVTTMTNVEHVEILAGGFPCQDVSLAGRRRGLKDGTRSGLWSEFARLIDLIRPEWVVIENVRGLLSANASGDDVESCPWCLGDIGERHALRALGAVLGDLADLGFDAEWTGIRASDVGAPHARFRVFILAWPAENTGRGGSGGRAAEQEPAGRDDAAVGSDPRGDGGREHSGGVTLLPTPEAKNGSAGPDYARAGRAGAGGDDLVTTVHKLMPTPTARDEAASGGSSPADVTLTDAVVRTGMGTHPNPRHAPDLVTYLPTPQVADADGGHATRSGARSNERLLPGAAVDSATDWGPYVAAVARWAAITRPAPAPVRMDGRGGKPRLNPELPEWMMGWPAGWVTDPAIGLTRAQQLKAAGNGVVPQQAAAGLRELLSRPGVPAHRIEAAA